MPVSVSFIKRLESLDPQLRSILIAMLEEIERQREESVTKKEFNELKGIVKELAEAQKQTDLRLNSLAQKVEELAEAQKRTEARVEELAEAQKQTDLRLNSLAQKVEELAEAQKRTEARVEELAEAQKRTEARVEELAEAQKRTEARVEELAAAQKKTEEEIRILVKRMDAFEERLEGISHSVGYSLENRVYGKLPGLLKDRYGIEIEGRLVRKYLPVDGKDIQVNIYGYGKRDGQRLLLLGECKVRPSKNEIRRFKKYAEKIGALEEAEVFLLVVAHDFPPAIERFLQDENIPYIWSYELEE
ncbi:hypothetical protein [Thermodesulforhabdus norvegica]|uniref:Chordopoxvirus fusion protein n=1 Tax=Thermodesulforhabdus norvegica TaxID=39841 RepID=A0A1I4R8C6_9BACT|nr:hypothetical protein [Thermodesulforhabdus norvegica]SFM48554.1 hypothetical protein SAMN05660836_00469 [Thermodesulforhabdus norvegica]